MRVSLTVQEPSPPLRRPKSSLLRRTSLRIVIIYSLWVASIWLFQGRLLYLPSIAGPGTPNALIDPAINRLWLDLGSGDATEAWLIATDISPAKGLVVFLHGNAELIDDCDTESRAWRERGYWVLLPEYRGYGRSGGSPEQDAIVSDVLWAIDAALQRMGGGDIKVILHGRSLGSGVAAQVAADLKGGPAMLVLESPFTSVASFAWGYGVPPFIVTNPYRTDRVLPELSCPIIIIRGEQDTIVPPRHGEVLASLNPRATLVTLVGDHNSGLSTQGAYWTAIDDALARSKQP